VGESESTLKAQQVRYLSLWETLKTRETHSFHSCLYTITNQPKSTRERIKEKRCHRQWTTDSTRIEKVKCPVAEDLLVFIFYLMSPYPTVVVVISAHQKASGIDLNVEPYSWASTWYTILANKTIPGTAKNFQSPITKIHSFQTITK